MYCPKCGQKNEEGSGFCGACGTPLSDLKMAVGMTTPNAASPSAEKSWWGKWWGILLLVISTGILGAIAIYLVWRSQLPRWLKWALTVLAVAISWTIQIMLQQK